MSSLNSQGNPNSTVFAVPRLTLTPLVMVLFFTVSGGAYGLEDLVSTSGPGMALILIIITPFIWSLPVALMVGELAAAMPEEGGYYVWVKKGLSPFWGFQVGWWSWLMSFVDMAIYPVLFADYLSTLVTRYFAYPHLSTNPWLHWLVALSVIWIFTAINIRGTKAVGDSSKLFGLLVLSPFLVLAVIGIYQWLQHPIPVWLPMTPPDKSLASTFSVGLFVVMWNYMGWDIVANVAGEIENPRKNIPLAMAITLPLISLAYLLPVFAGLTAKLDWQSWTAGMFPTIAAQVGGEWLGIWLGIAGLISSAGLFNALLLSFSRIPYVMAEDGYLPPAFTRLHPRYQSPYIAIIICSLIYSLFSLSAFASLIVIDVVLYAGVLCLEFATLIAFRLKHPHLNRPYKIPCGWLGIMLVTSLPLALLGLAIYSTLQEEGVNAIYGSIAALATGPLLYPLLNNYKKQGSSVPSSQSLS